MNYRQLEEGINKWTLELEEQEKVFLNQATQVNAWDRLLMENGEKIVKLHESVEKVKHDQQVRLFQSCLCFIRFKSRVSKLELFNLGRGSTLSKASRAAQGVQYFYY
jgi:hypothetical protein